MGRPRAFRSVEDVEKRVATYKEYLAANNKQPTIGGLAYFLDIDRKTLFNYAKNDKYFPTIKKYRDWVMASLEENAVEKGNGGVIFLMKNYGYTDRQEVSVEHSNFSDVLNKFVEKL